MKTRLHFYENQSFSQEKKQIRIPLKNHNLPVTYLPAPAFGQLPRPAVLHVPAAQLNRLNLVPTVGSEHRFSIETGKTVKLTQNMLSDNRDVFFCISRKFFWQFLRENEEISFLKKTNYLANSRKCF